MNCAKKSMRLRRNGYSKCMLQFQIQFFSRQRTFDYTECAEINSTVYDLKQEYFLCKYGSIKNSF